MQIRIPAPEFNASPEEHDELIVILSSLGPLTIPVREFLLARPDWLKSSKRDIIEAFIERGIIFAWNEAELPHDLGRKISSSFTLISPEPFYYNGLIQCHSAELIDHTHAIVKLLHPRTAQLLDNVFKSTALIRSLYSLSGASAYVSKQIFMRELQIHLRAHADFSLELNCLLRLNENMVHPGLWTPTPVIKLCDENLMVWKAPAGFCLPGNDKNTIPVDFTVLSAQQDIGRREEIANRWLRMQLEQTFERGKFPFLLNLNDLWELADGKLGFMHYAPLLELDERARQRQHRYISAVYNDDIELLVHELGKMLDTDKDIDIEDFRASATFTLRAATGISPGLSDEPLDHFDLLTTSPIAVLCNSAMKIVYLKRLSMPKEFMDLQRVIINSEILVHKLTNDFDSRKIGKKILLGIQFHQALQYLSSDELKQFLANFLTLVREAPEQLQQILSDSANGRFFTNVLLGEKKSVREAWNHRVKLIASSIMSVGLSFLLSRNDYPVIAGFHLDWPLIAALLALYAYIIVQWWKLR